MVGIVDGKEQLDLASDGVPDMVQTDGSAPVVLSAGAYEVHLPLFDGPFDLLLHLIRKEELDIFDISISQLTSAYLETLAAMQRSGIEPAGDFLLMAATLLQIKSRMLLPRPPSREEAFEDDIDPRAALVRQLVVYQAFKEVASVLDDKVRIGRDVFVRPTRQDRPPEEDPELPVHDIYRLAQAFRALMKRQKYQAPHEIYVERITIGERIAQIADRLAALGRVTFSSLCDETSTREDIITTFLALLEMAKLKLIGVDQREVGTPLYIQSKVEDINVQGEVAAGMLTE